LAARVRAVHIRLAIAGLRRGNPEMKGTGAL